MLTVSRLHRSATDNPTVDSAPSAPDRRVARRNVLSTPRSARTQCDMAGDDQGGALRGGAISRGVTRDGEIVRRPAGPWTLAVHSHLRRLTDAGQIVPEPLGVDGEEELLTYIDGTPLWMPGDPQYVDERTIRELGALLRCYHDVAETIGCADDQTWNRLPTEPAGPHRIICHNDFAPWNVIRTSVGLSIIDWDLAAPGTTDWDLAYASWVCAPLWNHDDVGARGLSPIPDRAERLAAFLDGYGASADQRVSLLDTLRARAAAAIDQAREWATEGRTGWRQQWSLPEPWRHGDGYRRDIDYFEEHWPEWKLAIVE